MDVNDMCANREVITGSDFKRMVTGAYSEFLLEYENINIVNRTARTDSSGVPGTNVLRTMAAAMQPLNDVQDDSIGGISRRVADAMLFGARGNAGVVMSQLFRGLARGLAGKYNATSSEFGKAFQYGILYAQRVIPENPDRPLISVAKGVAKGAYHAVRANLPISEILSTAIVAANKAAAEHGEDAGAKLVTVFLQGCLHGLGGHFVSPMMNFSLGVERREAPPNPAEDCVQPYCVQLTLQNSKADPADFEKVLAEKDHFVVVERSGHDMRLHLHTAHPGEEIEQAVGWGTFKDIQIINMSEPHSMKPTETLMKVAAIAAATHEGEAERLQQLGASIIIEGNLEASLSVGDFLNAAHSDMASSYVILANSDSMTLVLRQVKRVLGDRVEIVPCNSQREQEAALKLFDSNLSARENAKRMQEAE